MLLTRGKLVLCLIPVNWGVFISRQELSNQVLILNEYTLTCIPGVPSLYCGSLRACHLTQIFDDLFSSYHIPICMFLPHLPDS